MKRSYKNIFLSAVASVFVLASGCKKDWLDVNYNPKELTNTNAHPYLILPPLLQQAAGLSTDFEVVSAWMGYWAAPSLPPALSLTNYTNVSYGGMPGQALAFLEEKAAASGEDFYLGIAKTLRAVAWSRCVDKVNDVPYSEAFRSDILRPKYDDGKSIYIDLIKQLTQASLLIKNADLSKNEKITDSDIMFHGDKSKWLKFINTLKLRLLIHQANRPEQAAYIASEIQVIKEENSGFMGSGLTAAINPGYSSVGFKLNTYYGLYSSHNTFGGSRGDIFSGVSSVDFAHANEYSLNLLKADNDPRIAFIFSSIDRPLPLGAAVPFGEPAPASFRGSRFGLTINAIVFPYQNKQYTSAVGGSRNTIPVSAASAGIIKGNNMDSWVLTSIESMFLQAEAVQRGWLSGNPEQAYKEAVRESFRWLNVGANSANPALSDAVFDPWYASQVTSGNTKVSWAAAADKYKLLMYQKYMALNGIDPLETWVDYRRNGRFPDVPVSVDPTRLGNTVPFRLVYTPDEIVTNADNVKALGPIDMFTGKIWWMP
jgi:hypothetical protein